jgi:hypothetical protein
MTKVNIDGVEYDVDIDKAKQLGLIKPSMVRSVGQFFYNKQDLFLLTIVGIDDNGTNGMVCLINIHAGNRYIDAVPVEHTNTITNEEWNKITDGNASKFELTSVTINYSRK